MGGHDTASAVVAAGPVFVSAGTWLLVGCERPEPDLGAAARRDNFTNEIGALGGIRFLRNLAGSWLVEGCRPAWGDPGVDELDAAAAAVDPPDALLDVADPRFLHPADMLAEVTDALGLPGDAPPPVVVRGIVESQAAGTAAVLDRVGTDGPVAVVGGGVRSSLYLCLLSECSGRRVVAGPVEATALGNALVQGVALGVYSDLADARAPLAGGERAVSIEAVDRLEQIEQRVRTAGRVKVTELAVALDVSEMTIRRDLDVLAEQGVVQRVRGGAVAVGPQPFAQRFSRQARAKDRIAAKLAALVGDGGAVGVDASSTLQRLAGHLDHPRELTVVTNGQDTFQALQDVPGVTVLLTGGQLDRRTGSLVGPLATRAAREVLLRRLFVSAAALHPRHGTSEATLEEAEVKLALADVAAEVVVAVDSSKLGQAAPARGLPPERVDLLVTELEPADPALDPYRDQWRIL